MTQDLKDYPTREELGLFLDEIHMAKASGEDIEAPRKIILHFNRNNMKGFDSVGYFVYDTVKIYEAGRKEEAKKQDALTSEQKVFGGK